MWCKHIIRVCIMWVMADNANDMKSHISLHFGSHVQCS